MSTAALTEAIFIGANTHCAVSDINNKTKQIAFGAGNLVAIWDDVTRPELSRGVCKTLKGHKGDVLNVKFFEFCSSKQCKEKTMYLVTSSEDKTIKIWDADADYKLVQSLEGIHLGSIYSLCVSVSDDNSSVVLAAGSSDGKISIWNLKNDDENGSKFVLVTEFEVRKGFYALTLCIQEVGLNEYILFIGGTDPKIFVYSFTISEKIAKMNQCAQLPGHENWVNFITATNAGKHEYLIASGSLDRYIRLWKLQKDEPSYISDDKSEDSKKILTLLSNKKYLVSFKDDDHKEVKDNFSISFEALILGHDDWISSLSWYPETNQDSKETTLKLMSTSADTSIMIWQPDSISGVWVATTRLGELSIKGASTATGASGGFWSSIWILDNSTTGKEFIYTHGKTGSWRVWSKDKKGDNTEWEQILGITGPFKSVTDLCWSHNNDYLLSTSLDQTTRLYAPWKFDKDGNSRSELIGSSHNQWKEFARPQIHGYDMICVAGFVDNLKFVSAGDEKIMRSFNEPSSVFKNLQKFCGILSSANSEILPDAASLPTLGLSNKAEDVQTVSTGDAENNNDEQEREQEDAAITVDVLSQLNGPPLEDHLQRHTLFPELEKMYGHGYELTALDISKDGKYIVSCCKSNNVKHSVLRIFDTSNWLEIKEEPLKFHELTVNTVKFSYDDNFIVSVSRDRQIGIWNKKTDDRFALFKGIAKGHSRIIWDCDWAPPIDEKDYYIFVTGGRDKNLKIWGFSKNDTAREITLLGNMIFKNSAVTAVSVYPKVFDDETGKILMIAVGFENGDICIMNYSLAGKNLSVREEIDNSITPDGRVNRISWRLNKADNFGSYLLAVASEDHSLRLLSVY